MHIYNFIELTKKNYDEVIRNGNLPAFVVFYASWCSVSRGLMEYLSSVCREYLGEIQFASLDIDEESIIAVKNNIINVPTVIAFYGGREISRMTGQKNESEIKKLLRKCMEVKAG